MSRGDAIEVKGSDSAVTYCVSPSTCCRKTKSLATPRRSLPRRVGRLVIITCDDWDGKAWRSNIVTIAAPDR